MIQRLQWMGLASGLLVAPGCGDKDEDTAEPRVEGRQAGDCTDGADNDADGLFDCDDDSCAGSPDCAADDDGDGFTTADGDCDDADPAVYPGATEVCDDADTDEDCDGQADDADDSVSPDSLLTWHTDEDGDGYGAGAALAEQCEDPGGLVADDADCDDTDAAVNPGADEICDPDDVDENCNGLSGSDDPELIADSAFEFTLDIDGDSYGDDASTTVACELPSGGVLVGGDCNDEDASINPGATEVCDPDDVDEDCSGLADDADPGVDPSTQDLWYTDGDGDGYGDASAPILTCEVPSGAISRGGDCDDTDGDIAPGQPENDFDGVDSDCDGASEPYRSAALADGEILGEDTRDYFGASVAGGDLNSDGIADLVTSAYEHDATVTNAGRVYVFYGTTTGPGTGLSASDADVTVDGEASGESLGSTVAVFDATGDGVDDLLAGTPRGAEGAGAVYLFPGPLGSSLSTVSDAETTIETDDWSVGAFYGALDTAGDWDGDSVLDIVLGTRSSAGSVLIFGSSQLASGSVDAGDADWIFEGRQTSDHAYRAVGPGDMDGDGLPDLVQGAEGASGGLGQAYVFLGASAATPGTYAVADADDILSGEASNSYAGLGLAAVGDVDLDGLDDVLVGSYGASGAVGSYAGRAYLVTGAELTGTSGSLASTALIIEGSMVDNMAGYGVGAAGDLDADGAPDLLVGGPGAAGLATYGGGQVGVFLAASLPSSGVVLLDEADFGLVGTDTNEGVGRALPVRSIGDTDNDGTDDLVVGAPSYGGSTGRLLLQLGPLP